MNRDQQIPGEFRDNTFEAKESPPNVINPDVLRQISEKLGQVFQVASKADQEEYEYLTTPNEKEGSFLILLAYNDKRYITCAKAFGEMQTEWYYLHEGNWRHVATSSDIEGGKKLKDLGLELVHPDSKRLLDFFYKNQDKFEIINGSLQDFQDNLVDLLQKGDIFTARVVLSAVIDNAIKAGTLDIAEGFRLMEEVFGSREALRQWMEQSSEFDRSGRLAKDRYPELEEYMRTLGLEEGDEPDDYLEKPDEDN